MSDTQLIRNLKQQRSFAWAKYYAAINQEHVVVVNQVAAIEAIAEDPTLPIHLKNKIEELAEKAKEKFECPVCLDMIPPGQLEITNCGHMFCKTCLCESLSNEAKCPSCRRKLKPPT